MSDSDRILFGLSQTEAERRLLQYGLNQIAKPAEISFLGIAREEITEPMILLLLGVGILYTAFGGWEDALTIFSIIFVLVLVEIWNEYRAKKAITALSDLAAPKARVMRDNMIREVDATRIVPGDLLLLTQGTRIVADSKLEVAFSVQVDESALTGESLSEEKSVGNEIYAGTLVLAGEGKAEVFATGRNARIGKIASMAQQIKPPRTPLQLAMKNLAETLVWIALFFSILIPVVSFVRTGTSDIRQLILTGLALAFATIPEEAPIIITMILGLGSYSLSKRGFLVKKLKATEVLGHATVILTDKTGTITENRMQVADAFPRKSEDNTVRSACEALTEMSVSPTDRAILQEAQNRHIEIYSGRILRERGFEANKKTRAVLREEDNQISLYIIGAPEEIIQADNGNEGDLRSTLGDETAKGRRVIAVASRAIAAKDAAKPFQELENSWEFLGLISLEDPPRIGVKETIETARRAGIRTIMVTGDHPQTAAHIARSVGIPTDTVLTGEDLDKLPDEALQKTVEEVSVFARTTPEHKYRLVKALHMNGEIVAVTGDGVNDSLALKAADVGIAMGIKGTDAAREAADVVLTDDDFVSIGNGVFEGRKFFDNLRKGFKYYLSCKAALIGIFLLPIIVGVPLPLAPIQIIVLELFMDLAASAGFVSEPAEETIYTNKPRNPRSRFMNSRLIGEIAVSGASLFATVMLAYFFARYQGLSVEHTQTFAFSGWIMGHILLAFVSRSEKEPLYILGPFSNKVMDIWAVLAFGFLFVAVGVPGVAAQLKLTTLTPYDLGIVFAFGLATIFWRELVKLIFFRRTPKQRAK